MTDTIAPGPGPESAQPEGSTIDAAAVDRQIRRGLRLVPTPAHWVLLGVALVAYLVLPQILNDAWAFVFVYAGILALAGVGLNLLTGVGGQASLGTAAFFAIGAFTASYLGRASDLGGKGQPFIVYFVAAIVIGGAVGFVAGLPALRLRGPYLVIVTLGLVYLTAYVLNLWTEVSGGGSGAQAPMSLQVVGIDFRPDQGTNQRMSYLVWFVVAVAALLVRNVVRSRPGRALQAIRDRDVAAEVVGISLFRYKVGAFVLSSALGAAAGVFYVFYLGHPTADTQMFGLTLSVAVLSVVVVGGIGSMSGTIVGAVLIAAIPKLVNDYGTEVPFVSPGSLVSYGSIVVAALLVITLITQPGGIAALASSAWNGIVRPLSGTPGSGSGAVDVTPLTQPLVPKPDKDADPSIE